MSIKFVGSRRPIMLAKELCIAVSSPFSLDILIDLENDAWDELFEKIEAFDIRASFADTKNIRDSALDYQIALFLKKCPSFVMDDLEQKALSSFLDCEYRCNSTNEKLRMKPEVLDPYVDILSIAKSKLASILGSTPKELFFSFGPGANVGLKGNDTSSYSKYDKVHPTVSPLASTFAQLYLKGSLWGDLIERSNGSLLITDYAEVTFVPKTYKQLRTICIEPLMNTYFQKGFGSYLKSRLLRHGVNLTDQSINQDLASRAITEKLATIDFKSASDLISSQVVLELLPIDWCIMLDVFRSRNAKLPDGSIMRLSKYSAMGNAFTFELESLIFYCIAFAVQKVTDGSRVHLVNVFGDDVIIPQESASLFIEIAETLGFVVNNDKSFVSGVFFESCGMDFLNGINIRPFLLTNNLRDDNDIFECHNHLMAICERWKVDLTGALLFLKSCVCDKHNFIVPFPYAGGFWLSANRDPISITSNGWEGRFGKALIFQAFKRENKTFESALLHSFDSPSSGFRTLRKRGKWVIRKLFFAA